MPTVMLQDDPDHAEPHSRHWHHNALEPTIQDMYYTAIYSAYTHKSWFGMNSIICTLAMWLSDATQTRNQCLLGSFASQMRLKQRYSGVAVPDEDTNLSAFFFMMIITERPFLATQSHCHYIALLLHAVLAVASRSFHHFTLYSPYPSHNSLESVFSHSWLCHC